jgi:hypothetical protein
MKKLILAMCISLISIFVISCNQREEEKKQIDYQIQERTGSGISLPSISPEDGQSITPEINQDEKIASSSQNKSQSDYWSFLSDFRGIKSEVETPVTANIGINMKQDYFYPNLVCPDPVNDIVYYINYGKDYYIYELNGETSTLIVAKKANYIQLWEGCLYFLAYKDDNASTYNDFDCKSIYKYDLKAKKLELILDTNATNLYVTSEGIYYVNKDFLEDKTNFVIEGYHLDFYSNTPVKMDRLLFAKYKNNYLREQRRDPNDPNDFGKILLQSNNSDDEITVKNDSRRYNITISDNTLYYSTGYYLYSLDLSNGNQKVYDMTKADSMAESSEFSELDLKTMFSAYQGYKNDIVISDYVTFKDNIYAAFFSNYLMKINKDGKIVVAPIKDKAKIGIDGIERLYSSGKRLFALGEKLNNNEVQREIIELIITGDDIVVKNVSQ